MKIISCSIRILIFYLFILVLTVGKSYGQLTLEKLDQLDNPNFFQIKEANEQYWKDIPIEERKGWKQFKRWEYFWGKRTFPTGKFPDTKPLLDEINKLRTNKEIKKNDMTLSTKEWKLLGPIEHPEVTSGLRQQGLGRINRVRFHPTNLNEIWIGSASGGVWKTVDGGKNWINFPFTEFLSLGVSDIAISESNPNIVFVATGDIEPANSKKFYTIGLLKTTDSGLSWSVTGMSSTLQQGKQVGSVLVHPSDPNIVITGTNDGIYKSTDGGETFTQKRSGGYFVDLEFMPGNPNVIYGSTLSWGGEGNIFRSTNLGDTWSVSQTISGVNRIAIAVTSANPSRVYALCSDRKSVV